MLIEAGFMAAGTSVEQSTWISQHPRVTLVVGTMVFWSVMLLTFRRCWAQWGCGGLLVSLRLEGLRNAVATVFATAVFGALLLPNEYAALKDDVVEFVVLGAAIVLGTIHARILFARHKERRREEEALRRRGLPVRARMMSWRMVALWCYLGGPFVIVALAYAIEIPLRLLGVSTVSAVVVNAMAIVMLAGWLAGSLYLTARQWTQQRRHDRQYWTGYRAARRDLDAPFGAD